MEPKYPIYLFTHSFPEPGGEPYLYDEIEAIKEEGYHLIFCPYDTISDRSDTLNRKRIPKKSDKWEAISYVLGDFFIAPLLLTIKRFRYNVALVKERIAAARYYASQLPQNAVVYTYWFDELAVVASFIKEFRPDIKWISRAHGFDVYEEQSRYNFLFFKQNKLALIDELLVVSESGEKYLKNQHPRYAHKIGHSYLGTNRFGPSIVNTKKREFTFATCAILRSIKRLDLLMEMAKYLDFESITWHIIGDGQDMKLLQTKAKELPTKVNCIFHRQCTKEQISHIYSQEVDCFINVSSSEGLPVSIMEAISAGIPIIATDVGGTSEIVNPITGVLIDRDSNPKEIASIIHENSHAFKNPDYRKGVFDFWQMNFDAKQNYQIFYKSISS